MEKGRDLVKELQGKYDIFSEDEIRLLQDGGISVSDSEHFDSESLGEMYEVTSEHNSAGLNLKSDSHKKPPILSQQLLEKEREIMEERYKYEKNHVQLELANTKSVFLKRASELERVINRLKSEKKSLETLLETQKREFDYKLLE